ncbi:MAG TPA: hypothetical protein VJ063_12530, partial [Verrucomicrobiae bacterium]|nr:hypothetical protein [Verrucomicrobiae bacterium]
MAWTRGVLAVLALGIASAFGQPVNTPLVALGFTNTPIGELTWLEVIENGVLFVHDTADGAGVSVQLGEADSGMFLFPLTGYLYEGDTMEGKAYGSLSGVTDKFISSVKGVHGGGSSVYVTIDFSALGATRLNVFAGERLFGQITNPVGVINVYGSGYGCRANPWWRMPDGKFGALIELESTAAWNTSPPLNQDDGLAASYLFVQPDDPTNAVQYISRVDVTSAGLGSFCLTEARLGMFHQRHKALGQQVTLTPVAGQLVVGNLLSNLDGVSVELPGVSGFEMDFSPIELPTTNSTIFLFAGPGTASFNRSNGPVQVVAQTITDATRLIIRSQGAVVGSVLVSSNTAAVNLSGDPRLAGCAVMAKTAENLPGMAVRLDRPTTFTVPGGETFEGDELILFATEPAFYEALVTCAVMANGIESFTITGERITPAGPPPTLSIARSGDGIRLSWTDINRVYWVEVTANLA